MGTIAEKQKTSPETTRTIETIGDIVAGRHCPSFFENDRVKLMLPILQESGAGAAGVLDDCGRLTGMLTERDILRQVFAGSVGRIFHPASPRRPLDDMRVGDMMIRHPETLDDDLTVEEAAAVMLRRGYHFMPVVSHIDKGQFLGIVSERELAIQLRQELQEARRSEKAHKSILSYMLCEPYAQGYQAVEA
ncbi:MAG: CBS domain-containing protein [Alphaproteobacteria bacterium]|nr:CBS domain-containing protein [Alphaproteobacteria bacterium]